MGLSGALQVGRSGLLTSQAALQVTGQNLANMATEGYHRRTVGLAPIDGGADGRDAFLGRGVQIQAITRQVDEALESRLRGAIADESYSTTRQDLLAQIESIHNELSDGDLSSKLASFFNAWNKLANNPQDDALRSLVVEEGSTLAGFMRDMRTDLTDLRAQTDAAASDAAEHVNSLLTQIEELNGRIVTSGGGGAMGLKDERDLLLSELGQYLDISTVSHESGVTDVFVGSLPIVLNGKSRGVELRTQTGESGQRETDLIVRADGSPLDVSSGRLGALVSFRRGDLAEAIGGLDAFASQLIGQVNRVHSQGQGAVSFNELTGAVQVADVAASLNSAEADLDFTPVHGSFQVHVTQKSTGQRVTSTIGVDLDGINAGSDTTLTSLVADLDGVANIGATITADGRVQITGDTNDFEITFSQDSSGALAALGLNTFFTGRDASDIDVNATVMSQPKYLAAGQEHLAGDNRNALAIAALANGPADGSGGVSLSEFWNRQVEDLAVATAQARQGSQADALVRENLEAQRQQVSGVNADEEAINLLQHQRSYQASARFISVVDELMGTLLNMV